MAPVIATVDCAAITANLDTLQALAPTSAVMAVVKADGYGHGALTVARTARAWGAPWLGVAHPSEGLQLRAGGDTGRILAWLWAPGDAEVRAAVEADIDLSVNSVPALEAVVAAGQGSSRRPRIHLKIDTGMGRNGCAVQEWPQLLDAARRAPVEVVGVWTHLANADAGVEGARDAAAPGPSVRQQVDALTVAIDAAQAAGLAPQLRHCANTAGVIAHPSAHLDLVRIGIGLVGLRAMAAGIAQPDLRPAMRVTSTVVLERSLPVGASVGYGSTWIAPRPSRVGLVPMGYADGLPRAASGRARLLVDDTLVPIIGRVSMDQCVVDLTDAAGARAGSTVVVFGDPARGEPSADDLARDVDTIGYEIVTGLGSRVARRVMGES